MPGLWWESFHGRPARRLPAGAFVYLKGDTARSVYWLRSGLVSTSVVWRDGREYILRLVRPGELFAETSLGAAEYGEHARTLEAAKLITSRCVSTVGAPPRESSSGAAEGGS